MGQEKYSTVYLGKNAFSVFVSSPKEQKHIRFKTKINGRKINTKEKSFGLYLSFVRTILQRYLVCCVRAPLCVVSLRVIQGAPGPPAAAG